MTSLKKVLQKKKYIKIKLKRIATNHLELNAKINGIKGRFILDTGASNSCVDLDLIAYFNLHAEESETKAAGAGATDMETQKSTDNTLQIGNWKTNKSHLVLFDMTSCKYSIDTTQCKRSSWNHWCRYFRNGQCNY